MPEFKIVVDGWFPHESETDRVVILNSLNRRVPEALLHFGFDPRFEVVRIEKIHTPVIRSFTYRQRTRPFIHHLPIDREYVWERVTIPAGWRGYLQTIHQCDGPELVRSLADLSPEGPKMCHVTLKEGWVFHPEHKFNEYQIHTGLCLCGKALWSENCIPPAPQYPNADFTPFFGVPEITPVSWDTPPQPTPIEVLRARFGNGPLMMDPRAIVHGHEHDEPEPSVETTTAELRKMIGEINANRLRFDAEGKFREEGEPNPNKPPKKKWWRKKEK